MYKMPKISDQAFKKKKKKKTLNIFSNGKSLRTLKRCNTSRVNTHKKTLKKSVKQHQRQKRNSLLIEVDNKFN